MLIWNGKQEAIKAANNDCDYKFELIHNLSKNADTTSNLYIEADNLHALKYLLKDFSNKIKTIYIDPPYNTQTNFVYKDKLTHDDWLNMVYPRIAVAYKLLKEDGTMFISIDDNEYHNLIHVCHEIFGEENVETMVWHKVGEGDAGAGRMKNCPRFRIEHEYIINCYKNKKAAFFSKSKELPDFKNEYKNLDNDPRGAYKAGNISKTEAKSNPDGKNYYTVTSPSGKKFTRQWHFNKETFDSLNADKRIYWGKNGNSVPAIKIFIGEEREVVPSSLLINKGSATMANKQIKEMFNGLVFENSKPVKLLKYLINLNTKDGDIVLDFFAGSSATAHAVLELTVQENKSISYIMVQSPEKTDYKSIAYKKGFNTISELGYARICKAIDLLNEAYSENSSDLGFKFFREINVRK